MCSICQKTFVYKDSFNCLYGFLIDLETGILHKQIYEEQQALTNLCFTNYLMDMIG